jgi:hypothetical protein
MRSPHSLMQTSSLLKVRVSVSSILLDFIHDPRRFLLPLPQQKERQRRGAGGLPEPSAHKEWNRFTQIFECWSLTQMS